MASYEIAFNADDALRTLREYPGRTERATVRALNRALTSGRATLARLVAQDMGLKVGVAKEAIKVRQATASSLEIRLATSLKRIPVFALSARQTSRGVTYKASSAGRGLIPGAFIATMPTGHIGVFKRTGKQRQHPRPGRLRDETISEKFTASIGHVFAKHREAGIAQMRAVFAANLVHELEFMRSHDVAGVRGGVGAIDSGFEGGYYGA